jgi:hypothetical protein
MISHLFRSLQFLLSIIYMPLLSFRFSDKTENKKIARTLEFTGFSAIFLLPAAGLEPARGCPQQILSLPRLPFRHAGFML